MSLAGQKIAVLSLRHSPSCRAGIRSVQGHKSTEKAARRENGKKSRRSFCFVHRELIQEHSWSRAGRHVSTKLAHRRSMWKDKCSPPPPGRHTSDSMSSESAPQHCMLGRKAGRFRSSDATSTRNKLHHASAETKEISQRQRAGIQNARLLRWRNRHSTQDSPPENLTTEPDPRVRAWSASPRELLPLDFLRSGHRMKQIKIQYQLPGGSGEEPSIICKR